MKKAVVLLANGFEEVEALTNVDLLRRAGVLVKTLSMTGAKTVDGAHGVSVLADELFDRGGLKEADAIILPGGMPGSTNLNENEEVKEAVRSFYKEGKLVAAICAAPMVLGNAGILEGRKATCYPGFEGKLTGATYTKAVVEQDGNIITGNGPAAAFPFALRIITYLCGEKISAEVAANAQYNK